MADNNKNPRRTIWLSETEPLSHYDIWLSKNQHLNSDGDPILDSGVLRDCDYIFKVWDCDNWHPIVGLNSTAVNKIDTVLNTSYTTTHNGHSINSSSYLEFHLPLFTKPTSSPSELFDAGTIGEAILEYVTELEWKNIFEGDAFSYAFKWYIEEGDTNINFLVDPAEADKLGGIYADEFLLTDIFPDSIEIPSQPLINNSYNWIALAKYKFGYNTNSSEDYNLYISAKNIIKAITQYQEDNPNEPGITPGGGAIISPEVLYNSFYDSESIKRDWNDAQLLDAYKPRFSLWGACGTSLMDNAGKYLKIRDDAAEWRVNPGPYSNINNALVWQSAHDIVIEGTRYTTHSTKKYLSCLDGIFGWETNVGNTYSGSSTISINPIGNVISIMPYSGGLGEVYLCSENGNVSWQPIDTGTTYILGVGIKIDDEDNTINIKTDGAVEGLVLSYDGNGDVEWITVLSGGTEEYDAGDGIEILTPLLGNKIIKGNIKECDLNGYNSGFNASTSIEFRAPSGLSVIKDVITLLIDGNTNSYNIHPYTYTKISLASGGDIKFVIDGQTLYVNGNPIYVILEILGKSDSYTIEILDSLDNNSNDFISINNALTIGSSSYTFGCNVTKFLITMLFGIVKIEPLGYIESDRTEPESEPELEEPSEP